MVEGILFTNKRFDTTNDNNLMSGLTNNTIILCANWKVMQLLAEEIVNTINGKAEYNDYCCDDADMGKARYELNFGLQKVIDINGQKIILCLEPAMIYRAKQMEDIWFAACNDEKGEEYKEAIYPMAVFIGSKDIWAEGLDTVYRYIVQGKYGCYDGSWVKL